MKWMKVVPPSPRTGEQSGESGIAERGADTQPIDFFLGLDEAQTDILGVELDDVELLVQLTLLAREERPHKADALRAPPLELRYGEGHAAVLAPTHIAGPGELLRQREMVEPLDVHHHLLAGLEDDVGLDGAGPAGDPLRCVAGAMVGHDEEAVDVRALHHRLQSPVAPGVFGIGETRVFLRDDRAQARLEVEHR